MTGLARDCLRYGEICHGVLATKGMKNISLKVGNGVMTSTQTDLVV
jgi:hypothetical protein